MASKVEYPVCALCGSNRRDVVYADACDVLYGAPGRFVVVRCTQCSLVYLCPRPTQEGVADYYPAQYSPFAGSSSPLRSGGPLSQRSKIYAYLLYLLLLPYRLRFGDETRTLPPFGRRRMLDVGCGAGEYLRDMQNLGWDVYGVDVSDDAVRVARERVGTSRVWAGTIEQLNPSLQDLDLVTMIHSLEHVPDPRATLQEVYHRLTINGKVKIVVPDVSGFEAKLFGRHWIGLDVPRHFTDFSLQTLQDLLQQSGFYIESHRPQFWPSSISNSLDLKVRLLFHRRKHERGQQLIKLATVIATIIPAALSYALGNRGAVEVTARKAR